MNAKTISTIVIMSLAWTCGWTWAQGQTVYKSVDKDGNVTFSDSPPADAEVTQELQVNAPQPQPAGDQQQALEDMRETTDRMAADRREREKHRAEMKEMNARNSAVVSTGSEQPSSDYDDYYPVVPGYSTRSRYYHGPHRPGYKPKPEHPIARPPLQHQGITNNQQLMRPMVSGNRGRAGGR
ncbi:MAG: DUF4124 domain-containing protein [Halioglobus sp.]